jgi:hypothetical protein
MVRGICEGDRRVARCGMIRIMGWDRLIEYFGETWEGEEGLRGLGLEVERSLAERGRDDYYERIEGYCLIDDERNVYVASVKWVFQVMEDGGRRFWFEGVELGRAEARSVEDVVVRIVGGAVDREAEGEKRKVKVRIGGGMTTAQQHTTRNMNGERYIPSRNTSIIEDGWSEEVSAGLRQILLRPCH